MAMIKCPECGKDISDKAEACPNCGCPITREKEEKKKAETSKKNKTEIVIICVILIALLVACVAIGVAIKNNKDKAAKNNYEAEMTLAGNAMLEGASDAEEAGGLIHDVWYNTIYKKSDTKTDKYTKKRGVFNSDFNTSILTLQVDSTFSAKIKSIKDNQDLVLGYMKKLANPSEEFREAYQSLKTFYDSYLQFTNMAVNPTGNLSSYTSSFNEYDQIVSKNYQAWKVYCKD